MENFYEFHRLQQEDGELLLQFPSQRHLSLSISLGETRMTTGRDTMDMDACGQKNVDPFHPLRKEDVLNYLVSKRDEFFYLKYRGFLQFPPFLSTIYREMQKLASNVQVH